MVKKKMKNLRTYQQFIFEGVNSLNSALEEIKSKATSTFRANGLIFGEDGMAEIYIMEESIKIGTLISFRKGGGNSMMETIISITDKYKVPIKILAESYSKSKDYYYKQLNIQDDRSELTQKDLVNWYKKLGFEVISKTTKSSTMIRKPK